MWRHMRPVKEAIYITDIMCSQTIPPKPKPYVCFNIMFQNEFISYNITVIRRYIFNINFCRKHPLRFACTVNEITLVMGLKGLNWSICWHLFTFLSKWILYTLQLITPDHFLISSVGTAINRLLSQIVLGVIHNSHHFHKRTNRTLGEGVWLERTYAFLNVEK